ncbi:MAG: hypothetical protein PHV33_11090 [Elusimicrobiales bacterium]|nr:hypothetical protein [Elusimicrobiales bacterium]
MKELRKLTAALLRGCLDFGRKHRVLGFLAALLLGASCAGAVYLIAQQFPTVIALPCFTGGCGE